MSPVAAPALTPIPPSPIGDLLTSLATAPSNVEAKSIADSIALSLKKAPRTIGAIQEARIVDVVLIWAGSSSGYERESAAVLVERICKSLGTGVEGIFLPLVPALLSLAMDKGQPVRSAVTSAMNALIKATPVEGSRVAFDALCRTLEDAKGWKTKVASLKAMENLVKPGAEEWVAAELGRVIPAVEHAMHDTKAEVSSAAIKAATTLCGTLPNPDVLQHISLLVSAMASPAAVPGTIKGLSSTTFVAEVTGPTLAVLVPLLTRALKERSTDTQRMTCIVIGNLVKLVRDPTVAARYLSPLVHGVDLIAKGAAFPEIRAFAQTALDILTNAGASASATPAPPRDVVLSVTEALTVMVPYLDTPDLPPHPSLPLAASMPDSPIIAQVIEHQANIVADLVDQRKWDAEIWEGKGLGSFMKLLLGSEQGATGTAAIRKAFLDIDRQKYSTGVEDDGEGGELLCDIQFSLAYGGLLLLNHTQLKLRRGQRYGICAANGAGKSTLMKAIRDGKVEGFPSQDELKCIMVEHALQGEDTSMTILDFIASDPKLAKTPRADIAAMLFSVGFSEEKQQDPVASLSGGWKMKLELARAMLFGADILLLDEPTNHLDVETVAWLEQYICNLSHVTCLIVSHDSGFLDNVCTQIIHYESKKLAYYPGNLSKFVEKVPSAKSYYTLAATSIKFTFPPPGSLMGVRSNTRAIMKLSNCTFTYPGMSKPSLVDVSCALSLSSRVGIVGPNGAGKSTLIKLLTGETIPDSGQVFKHPALRVGYVAQHAFHHINQHLDKTAVQYIQWRYEGGWDKEMNEKATRVLTDEDREMMERPIEGRNGELRKIEFILGRQKLKKSFQYEIKFKGYDHKYNAWIPRDVLLEKGFTKLVGQFDDLESSREGAGMRDTSGKAVREVLEAVGLDGDIAQYNEMSGLSGGQKVKVVIAASMFNRPQCLFLDEPTNFLDREALGGLAGAIKEWTGAVCIISHSQEFVSALCPEIWHVDGGRMTHKGKVGQVDDGFGDDPSRPASRTTSKAGTPRTGTPLPVTPGLTSGMTSATGSAVNSEAEDGVADGLARLALKPKKKKKKTRNEIKASEERKRIRKANWLSYGGEREPDTEESD
ncbi:mRNA export factor elf1 [Kockovaella imperatae]|uniref:mRNA export factor elf1 n=1 Tax=Kockovaella imperatae TaxID=4999 RepID=A0A1Y1UHA1_9TREE|nr:mRNA export factor elf1 [Kockovaella imperatae]ORX36907.1 mRNA export factor elf1 [Kockovaella imperatae]